MQLPKAMFGRDMSVYVKGAIGSKWCNPFSLKKYTRDESLKLYEEYIRNDKKLMTFIVEELDGKNLGCWCHPEACHGDVLRKIIKEKKEGDKSKS